ncbi:MULTISPECIES: pyridoxal phosphate-dependent aminotransferase [Jonquetella]|uniref:pyridoxal phosphate-dependent aminotransferase n=1 Tax=Jonquetella TaxID=428711 RepID=UPI0009DBCCC0|nr:MULTISPECIES: pyridoxal phosphate-dependent aminotransferase [Jonquetella]
MISLELSKRARNLQPSATLAVSARAAELKRQGRPVISFGAGEPDFDSPDAVKKAGHDAIESGKTHYTPNPGTPELREAVCVDYSRRFGLDYAPSEVLVGSGAKPLIYCALAALLDDGDEVILPVPAWVSYVEQIKLCGGKAVLVETGDTNHLPLADRLEAAVTPRSKCILINSPNNPTGAVYDEETLKAIASLALRHDLVIINDEIYEQLVYEGAYSQIVKTCPEVKDRTINVNGVSKAFAMTGWRIGFALGPAKIIKAMAGIQGHLNSCACSVSQAAALGGLQNAQADVAVMRQAFSARRQLVFDLLAKIPGVSFVRPKGAFYVLVDLKNFLGKRRGDVILTDDAAFCSDLLEYANVAATPGSAFFAPGTMRLSYANSEEDIREGLKRLASYVASLQ